MPTELGETGVELSHGGTGFSPCVPALWNWRELNPAPPFAIQGAWRKNGAFTNRIFRIISCDTEFVQAGLKLCQNAGKAEILLPESGPEARVFRLRVF